MHNRLLNGLQFRAPHTELATELRHYHRGRWDVGGGGVGLAGGPLGVQRLQWAGVGLPGLSGQQR